MPSKVLNLNYEIVNKTAICVYWDAPLRKNGKLTKYLVSYTPNSDWPLDDWFNKSVPITNKKSKVSRVIGSAKGHRAWSAFILTPNGRA